MTHPSVCALPSTWIQSPRCSNFGKVLGSGTPRLLLVSHADNADEVVRALEEHGLPKPLVGAGGDDTLDVFEEAAPDVVIMVAGLAEGDVPSLAAAIRSGHYGRPAPVVLILGEAESIAATEAAKNPHFERVLRKPFLSSDLAAAVRHCGAKATGARMSAAMDQAIESFVLDAMDSLGSDEFATAPTSVASAADMARVTKPVENGTGETASEDARAGLDGPQPQDASRVSSGETQASGLRDEAQNAHAADQTAILRPMREPTAVLGEEHDGPGPLSAASKALLDEVLPGETLDVDLDELDSVDKTSSEDAGEPEPPGGGDFARQLRMKMSAMAERLFPGQGDEERTASISPVNAMHTEIDLGEIAAAGTPEPIDDGSHPGTGTGTSDSDITMAREPGSGSSYTKPHPGNRAGGQALVGNLGTGADDIAALLARLWRRGFSGALVLVRDQEEKRLQFDVGRIVFASSTEEADRMGELLLRQGKINSQQLADCREHVKASGRRLGEVLVDQGHLKPRELLPAVRQHLEDIVYSVFAWTDGNYDALPEHTINERIRLSSHPAALIVEGIRRKYDRQRLEACLGGMGQVLINTKVDEQLSTIAAADLSGPESEAQRLFDGEHTLHDVRAESELQGLRVAQLAYAWVCLGVAELVDRSSELRDERSSAAGYLVGETDLAIDRQRVRAKHLLVQDADYFQLLGVRPDASGFEIRRAYESALRHFSFESFPAALQDELRAQLEEIGAVIEEAYLVLSDDQIRSKYRANLR